MSNHFSFLLLSWISCETFSIFFFLIKRETADLKSHFPNQDIENVLEPTELFWWQMETKALSKCHDSSKTTPAQSYPISGSGMLPFQDRVVSLHVAVSIICSLQCTNPSSMITWTASIGHQRTGIVCEELHLPRDGK